MEITTDISLKGKTWENILGKLKGTFFDSYWQVYALCASIGIMQDKQKENEVSEDEPKTIPRNVLIHHENSALLDFMFQTAILTTTCIEMDEDRRLELAFGKEKNDFKRLDFLTKFANYGAHVINKEIETADTENEMMGALMTFLNATYLQETKMLTEDLEEYEEDDTHDVQDEEILEEYEVDSY